MVKRALCCRIKNADAASRTKNKRNHNVCPRLETSEQTRPKDTHGNHLHLIRGFYAAAFILTLIRKIDYKTKALVTYAKPNVLLQVRRLTLRCGATAGFSLALVWITACYVRSDHIKKSLCKLFKGLVKWY